MSEDQISYLRLPIHPAIGGDLEAEWVLGITVIRFKLVESVEIH